MLNFINKFKMYFIVLGLVVSVITGIKYKYKALLIERDKEILSLEKEIFELKDSLEEKKLEIEISHVSKKEVSEETELNRKFESIIPTGDKNETEDKTESIGKKDDAPTKSYAKDINGSNAEYPPFNWVF